MKVLYLNGSHAWLTCDDCNQMEIFNWDRYNIHITSELTGAQIQFNIVVPSGLAAKLMRLPLVADSEFSMS